MVNRDIIGSRKIVDHPATDLRCQDFNDNAFALNEDERVVVFAIRVRAYVHTTSAQYCNDGVASNLAQISNATLLRSCI